MVEVECKINLNPLFLHHKCGLVHLTLIPS